MREGGPMLRQVYKLLFDREIYSPIDQYTADLKTDLQGWGGHREYFKKHILDVRPELIIEVGTWKGRSAVTMADICRDDSELSNKTEIVCVDTWLGAPEFWNNHDDEKRYKSLRLANGYPQVYYQFLRNVIDSKHEHRITPFPQTSENAYTFLKGHGVKADLIYIDGAHEFNAVYRDIERYWELLRPGGIMIGDDYCDYWSGVRDAVNCFFMVPFTTVEHERWENPGQSPSDYWMARKYSDV